MGSRSLLVDVHCSGLRSGAVERVRRAASRSQRRRGRFACRAAVAWTGCCAAAGAARTVAPPRRAPVHVRVAQTAPRRRPVRGPGRTATQAARHGIERMRFALGVDEDLSAFQREFARDPLIGPSIRRRAVAAAEAAPRALRGACLGDLRAADRVRACRRDPAAHRGLDGVRAGARWAELRAALCATCPARRARRRRPGAPRVLRPGRVHGPAPAGARRARGGKRAPEPARPPSTSGRGAGCARSRAIGPWTVEMLALHGQGRHDQLPAGDLGLLKYVGRGSAAAIPGARRRRGRPLVLCALRSLARPGGGARRRGLSRPDAYRERALDRPPA